ncbi:MAG: formyltransferase family protein [archaeon]
MKPLFNRRLFNPSKGPMRIAIFMSGSGTNANKILEHYLEQTDNGRRPEQCSFVPALIFTDNYNISKALEISRKFKEKLPQEPRYTTDNKGNVVLDENVLRGITFVGNDIRAFYGDAGSSDMKSLEKRAEFDAEQADLLAKHSIDMVVLAGYDRIVTSRVYNRFLTINMHPANLRAKSEHGKPIYPGLAWVPSAKAILNGDRYVNSSVHIVTGELDGGPLLAVSEPQPVNLPEELEKMDTGQRQKNLLGIFYHSKDSFKSMKLCLDNNPHLFNKEHQDALLRIAPLGFYAKDCQERLKVHGDWVIYPQVIEWIAQGSYSKDWRGRMYFDKQPIPNGVDFQALNRQQ